MKKFLLFSAAILCAGSLFAKDYTLFSSTSSLTWTGGTTGYTAEVTVDGVNFTLSLAKGSSTTNCISPAEQIRVYKNANFTIKAEGLDMKTVSLTGAANYAKKQSVSEGWTLADPVNNVSVATNETGSDTFTMTCSDSQFRIATIVVSDEVGSVPPTPEVTYPEVASVEATKALASKTTITVNYPLTVAFKSANNLFCVDENGDFIQIYGANSYVANDVIPAGWKATYELYGNTTPELLPVETLPASQAVDYFQPATVAAADINVGMVNSVVKIENVEFAEATPATKSNFEGVSEGVTLNLRNNYTLASVDAGTYNVTVVVTIYSNEPSLYVVSYDKVTGVESAVENAASVRYYNLLGAEVANPANGIFVKVANGKATKVVK